MKRYILLLILVLFQLFSMAQSRLEKQVVAAVNLLAKAMVEADGATLHKMVHSRVSYGHSSGLIENKEAFINKIITGQSDFVSMDITKQIISMHKRTAIVRHHIDCKTNDNQKPGEVSLEVLTVWQKKAGQWKLIARQAVRPK